MRAITTKRKPILCLDFDGVIHSYKTGWKGESIISDPPVEGALEFMYDALHHFRVAIYSSRSSTPGGINAMQRWLEQYCREKWRAGWWLEVEWPTHKPSAFVTIDDRAILFEGKFPPINQLLDFKSWVEKERGGE